MKETKWQAYNRREKEREEMTSELKQGVREINKSMNEFEGWADRIMGAILKPAGTDAVLWYDSFKSKNGGTAYKREQ